MTVCVVIGGQGCHNADDSDAFADATATGSDGQTSEAREPSDGGSSDSTEDGCPLACENGGTCEGEPGAYVCTCPVEFEGETCSTPRPTGLERRPHNPDCVAPLETPEGIVPSPPLTLSQTGCFGPDGTPNAGLVPYSLRAPLWSDGAEKARHLALPDGSAVTLDERGDFLFPVGTVLTKDFIVDEVRVETRLFMQHARGLWAGYSYAWIDDHGDLLPDAMLLPETEEAVSRPVPGVDAVWTYPTRTQCLGCHTDAAGGSLGLEVGHLNHDLLYPTQTTANQLFTLWSVGMVDGDIAAFGSLAYPAYDDATASLDDRVWSYFNVNCSGCHFRQGGSGALGRSSMPDVRYNLFHQASNSTHWLASSLCGTEATAGDLGLGDGALLVSPGSPGRWSDVQDGGSVLYLRMSAREHISGSTGTMPPIGTQLLDTDGLALIAEWIEQLQCP